MADEVVKRLLPLHRVEVGKGETAIPAGKVISSIRQKGRVRDNMRVLAAVCLHMDFQPIRKE